MGYKKSQKTVQTVSHEIQMTGKELREMIQDKMPEARLPEVFPLTVIDRQGAAFTSNIADPWAIKIRWAETEEVEE